MRPYNVFISVGAISDEFLTDPYLINQIEREVIDLGAVPLVHRIDDLSEASIKSSIEKLSKSSEFWCILTPSIYERLPYIWMEVAIMRYRRMIENASIKIFGIKLFLPKDENYKTKLPVILRPTITYDDEYERELLFIELKQRVIEWHKQHLANDSGGENEIAEKNSSQPSELFSVRNKVFISYAHKDKYWLNQLETHIRPYERIMGITVWNDKQIEPGRLWRKEISSGLASTKVAVLLVSPEFLKSDFIINEEVSNLLSDEQKGGLTILWVPIKSSAYEMTKLKDYEAAHPPERPLASLRGNKRSKALVDICKSIIAAYYKSNIA